MTWLLSALCLAGTVLNVKKKRICFVLWAVGNAAWLIYDIAIGLYSRAILDAVQLGFAVWGYSEWKQKT
jgi:hypothetical protein